MKSAAIDAQARLWLLFINESARPIVRYIILVACQQKKIFGVLLSFIDAMEKIAITSYIDFSNHKLPIFEFEHSQEGC